MTGQEPHILRPEARPFTYEELHRSQREAFEKIIAAMAEAARNLDKRGQADSFGDAASTDRKRSNRTLLLSGERGTGKTSVLLTVRDYLLDRERLDQDKTQGRVIPPDPCPKHIKELHDGVVWLETLDMDPLPKPTNLLAAILERIDEAIKPKKEDPCLGSEGLLGRGHGIHAAVRELIRIETDVSLAWDGNVIERAANLDPDTYATEVMRAEKARLSLNSKFTHVLDSIADESKACDPSPIRLFVLPVDDVDLNPIRCLDLLRLLRAINSPRLFVVTLGSLESAEIVAWVESIGQLAELGKNDLSRAAFDGSEVHAFGHRVAANALRKLLPPEQRIQLQYLPIEQALEYRPPGVPNNRSLRSLLRDCKLTPDNDCKRTLDETDRCRNPHCGSPDDFLENLGDLLLGKALQTGDDPDGQKHLDKAYDADRASLKPVFICSVRELADLWFFLNRLLPKSKPDRFKELALLAATQLHQAILDDPGLTPDDRRRVAQAVDIRSDRTIQFDAAVVIVEEQASFYDTIGRRDDLPAIYLSRHDRWSMRPRPVRSSGAETHGGDHPRRAWFLSDRTSAWFRLLYDILFLHPKPHLLVGGHRIPMQDLARYAVAFWYLPEGKVLQVPWIPPPLGTFWAMDRFLAGWNDVLKHHDDKKKADDDGTRWFVAAKWIEASAWAILGKPRVLPERREPKNWTDDWSEGPKLIEWIRLAAQASKVRGQTWHLRQWLRNLVVMLAPESGVPETSTKKLVAPASEPSQDNSAKPELVRFWHDPQEAFLIRRMRGWLTRDAWTNGDVEAIAALVNPTLFADQVLRLLEQIDTDIAWTTLTWRAKQGPALKEGELPMSIGGADAQRHSVHDAQGKLKKLAKQEDSPSEGQAGEVKVALEGVRKIFMFRESNERNRRYRQALDVALYSWPLYSKYQHHPLNEYSELCPNRDDVPKSPNEEGLWPWLPLDPAPGSGRW